MISIDNINGLTFSGVFNQVDDIYQKTGDKDIYEEVIDALMVEKYSEDKDLKEYIKSLPKDKKRSGILSLISNDNVLWTKIVKMIEENKAPGSRLKDVILMLRDYVKIADVERKTHGEILTPFEELAKPMVNLIDKYDLEFWKNPNHKVLDSSAGYGTFLILAAYKFMNGLKEWEPDEEKRFKWIVENCLYYGELQAKSVFSWLVAIDPFDKYKTNTYFGSFLDGNFDKHIKEVWGVEKFDLIIQNPPYQTQKNTLKNLESKSPKTQPLWHLFVQKSLKLLKENGYMVMVHPGGWREIDGQFKGIQNLIKSLNLIELHLFSYKNGLDVFGAKTNFDYYILKNEKNISSSKTKIYCENGIVEEINLLNIYYIPGENILYINSLFSESNRVSIISDSKYHTQQGEKNKFLCRKTDNLYNLPCVYMVSCKNEPSFWFSNINKGHFGIPKVIWGNGSSGVIIDYKGEYGLTQFSRAIVDNLENLENIKKALESEKFIKNVMLFKNGLGHKYNSKVISMLNKDFWKEFI